ncbi:MAG: MFS transporter [Anaerolineae bacterium]|nr:MFS transporter [Anaerolineae bacterium]
MLGIGMGVLMSTLDGGIVNIALPTLEKQLNTDFPTVQWITISYLLVITATMLGAARLGDMYDKKKLYMGGLVLFTVGSFLCSQSPDVYWLIGFRAVQGLGAVLMTALGNAIITEVFPASERGRALGMMGSVVSVGIALGPTVGGVLIGRFGWHSIFLVNLPVGVVAAFVVARVVPSLTPHQREQRFDRVGALYLLVTLLCYTLGMTIGQDAGFDDPNVSVLLVAAGGLLALFLWIEASVIEQPMVDLSLFRNLLFGINLLMGLLVFVVLSGLFIMPFFLTLVKGYPTEQVGLLIAVVPVAMGLVSPWSGNLSDRFGSRIISLVGLVIIAVACLLISTLNEDITPLDYVLRLAPLGIGIGVFQSPNNSAIMGAAPRERLGVASGLLSLSRTLGQVSGMPLIGAIFAAVVTTSAGGLPAGGVTEAPPGALVAGVNGVFRLAAVVVLLSAALAALAWRLDARQRRVREQLEASVVASVGED